MERFGEHVVHLWRSAVLTKWLFKSKHGFDRSLRLVATRREDFEESDTEMDVNDMSSYVLSDLVFFQVCKLTHTHRQADRRF